jgi:hypothetical protein
MTQLYCRLRKARPPACPNLALRITGVPRRSGEILTLSYISLVDTPTDLLIRIA